MPILAPGVQSNIAGMPQIAYDRNPIREWQANTPFLEYGCDFKPFERRTGRTMQFYGQKPYGASINPATEAVPPPSDSLQQVISSNFMNQYVNWIGIDDVVEDTFVNNIVIDATRNLGYGGALTGNLVASNVMDSTANGNANARIDLGDNEFFNGDILRRAESSLANGDVPTREEGMYQTFMSSLVTNDLFNDNTAGSPVDVLKRSAAGQKMLQQGIVPNYSVLDWAGCRIIRTSTVPTYANYPSTGKTGYGTFVIGREIFLASELSGKKAPRDPNYKVRVTYQQTPDLANPALQTACIVDYNFYLGVAYRPQTNPDPGFRRVRCEVSIV